MSTRREVETVSGKLSQVIEWTGGSDGARTRDLRRDRPARKPNSVTESGIISTEARATAAEKPYISTRPSQKLKSPRGRQLALPGLDLRPAPPLLRARRDLSELAFKRALERHGFVLAAGGARFVDITTHQYVTVEPVHRTDPVRLDRRATLAKLIRSRMVRS